MAGGRSVNAGWNPPAEMANAGRLPVPMRISSEPLNSTPPSFESRSRASMAMRPDSYVVVAEHVGGQLDEPRRVDLERWRRGADGAEDGQAGEAEVPAAERAGELGEHREAARDDRRRAPVDLDRRPDDEAAGLDREHRAQPAEDARRVLHRVGREEDVVVDVGAERFPQLVDRRPVLQADDAADRGDVETEPDLPRRMAELGEQEQEERPAGRLGRLGVDDADRLDRETLERQLEHPGVLALVGIEAEEAAAADRLGIDPHADAGRGLEPEVPVEQAEVGLDAASPQVEAHADAVDGQVERADVEVDAGRQLEAGRPVAGRPAADGEPALLDAERPEAGRLGRDLRFDAARRRAEHPAPASTRAVRSVRAALAAWRTARPPSGSRLRRARRRCRRRSSARG